MATYEYRCADCGHVFEHHEHMEEHASAHPKCPQCQSVNVQQVYSTFFAQTARKT